MLLEARKEKLLRFSSIRLIVHSFGENQEVKNRCSDCNFSVHFICRIL